MCGLVVSISRNKDLSLTLTEQMLAAVNHRGPDYSGTFIVPDIDENKKAKQGLSWATLGHNRLAIIDVSDRNSQPMVSNCKRYSIVFNGEIYNFKELRFELEKLGAQFRTSGDSEVLMLALIYWGKEALARLQGMFAFVFVDHLSHSILAGRDRYGIKPLYYWSDGEHLHFASEIKQFTVHPKWQARLENSKALDFLLFGLTDIDRNTMFQGVHHVLPGTILVSSQNIAPNFTVEKWWNPKRTIFSGTFEEAVEEYESRFRRSLSLHLRSDVEIASCLSGGLDSSAIVGSAARWFPQGEHHHQTFTAVSENSKIDERQYARSLNAFAGTIGTEILPSPEKLWMDFDRLTWHQDEPFGSTSIFAQWCVFEKMKEKGVKVALDGQGADEQLCGYDNFISLKVLNDLEHGRIMRAITNTRRFSNSGRTSMAHLLMMGAYRYLPESLKRYGGQKMGLASMNANNWIAQNYFDSFANKDPFLINDRHPKNARHLSWDMVDRVNLPMLLRFEDRNSMAFGIEARVPFVDHELMEFALSLPDDFLIRKGQTKAVLRSAVQGNLPIDVRERRDKIGFQTAESEWFKQNPERVIAQVRSYAERATGVLSPDIVNIVSNQMSHAAMQSPVPWRTLSFLNWMKVFDVHV
jgi:asparagine synthase (glutamine-hydrolysing)